MSAFVFLTEALLFRDLLPDDVEDVRPMIGERLSLGDCGF